MSTVYISLTRLRLRSARFLPAFIPRVWSSGRQAQELEIQFRPSKLDREAAEQAGRMSA